MKATQSPVFRRYTAIRQAVYNPRCKDYERVGAQGVTLYWDNSQDFHDYVIGTLGPPPDGFNSKLTRIDLEKNYEPGNLKWEDPSYIGSRNVPGKTLTYQGQSLSIREWSRVLNLPKDTIYSRLGRGLPVEQVLKPSRPKRPKQVKQPRVVHSRYDTL